MSLYRHDEARLETASDALPWSFDADGTLFRLVSEAYRIRLGYLFDPLIAVHTSLIEPLPHQITAVYETMLTRQPLRYLLAANASRKLRGEEMLITQYDSRGELRDAAV
jgi:hypothetical protein